MNGNRYVDEVVAKYRPTTGPGTPVYEVGKRLRGLIQRWYSTRLVRVYNSGSFAKGTSIRGGVDLDLFISLKPGTGKSLHSIYESLYRYADDDDLNPRRQNVSVGVEVANVKVDLVPARKHKGTEFHSLYFRRRQGFTKTNVDRHISLIRKSGKSQTIRATKIWRRNRGLRFPSFYLELAVLRALDGRPKEGSGTEVTKVLRFLADRFKAADVLYPANELNLISDDLSLAEKGNIANQAQASLVNVQKSAWDRVLW